jgi:glucose-1-phosphate thymidylyltransferase
MPKANKIRGVILAAGRGVRLKPLTDITNKMLLPIFDRPMIIGPIESFRAAGISDICLVTNHDHLESFRKFLGDGSALGVRITYAIQPRPAGIADALLHAERFANGSKIVLLLGDNIFERVSIPDRAAQDDHSYIFIKDVKNPERFGVAEMRGERVANITEKPRDPKTRHAVTGLYIYPGDVFDVIRSIKPSERGELEITDVNNYYIRKGKMKAIMVEGYWFDAGTLDSLLRASILRAVSVSPGILKGIDKDKLIEILTES